MKLPKSHLISAKMLLIGAGKMGKLVFKHLASKGCRKIVVVQAPVEVHIPWCMKYHDIFWVIASLGDGAWNALLALGNITFAYTFADVLIEIQNTLKSPPAENKTMKKATFYGVGLTTVFYLALGCTGYAAFGNNAPGNILTGFGFYEPFWLVDIANICIIVHLLGAYQVYAQPIFAQFEKKIAAHWPEAKFINTTYTFRLPTGPTLSFTLSKLVLRSIFILFTTLVAMLLPFFNAVLGLIGALGFWPLSVYFPVRMHLSQNKIRRGAPKWIWLQSLSLICMLVSIGASVGSVEDIITNLKHAAPFKLAY